MKVIYFLPIILLAQLSSFAQSYSGGSGTIADPYLIANKTDLKYLSENAGEWSKNFKQTSNIYFTTADFTVGGDFYNSGNGFIPIGTPPFLINMFSGTYNGDGHLIDGLTINRPGTDGVGLFGAAQGNGAIIQSLGLTNVNVIGHFDVAGLVGSAYDTLQVIDCYVTGSITGINAVGGLLGDVSGVTVDKCHADVTVSGTVGNTTGDIGGLMGFDAESFVYRSYSSGTVTASVQNGGFIGRAQGTTLVDNYSTASVTGGYMTAGFVGAIDGAILQNCYSTGLVPNSGTFIGGFAGAGNASSAATCFWDQETSGQTTSSFGTPKSSLQMKTQTTFTNAVWDFVGETANGTNDYWKMGQCNNNGYPVFQWQQSVNYPTMSYGTVNGNVNDSATVCFNNSASAGVLSWNNIVWYDSITGGNSVAMGSNFTSPQLTETTTYYAEVNDGSCVNPFRLAYTVVVNPENTTSQTLLFCNGSGSVTVGSNTYTVTGTYIDTLTAANGCDSIVTTHLTIQSPVNVATTTNGLTISASANGATYQWINCTTNTAIAGETGQSFTATANGSYAVVVTDGLCSDTSSCVNITTVGLTSLESGNLVVYPNPGNGLFNVKLENSGSEAKSLKIKDVLGNEIYSTSVESAFTIDLSSEPNGVYFILLSSENNVPIVRRIVKE